MRRAAIIGTGGIARQHAEALVAESGRVTVAAAMDVDADRLNTFCNTWDIPGRFGDVQRMLDETKPEIVCVCTPPHLHAPLSIQAMESGAWVYCEKPMVSGLAELDEVEAAEGRTGRYCESVFQTRFCSGVRHVRRLMSEGVLGRPLVAVCHATWYRSAAYYEVPWRGGWNNELGGAMVSQGIHNMDALLYLLGDWEDVRAVAGALDRDIEVDDVTAALIRFRNGAIGTILHSVVSPAQETRLRIDFQNATVQANTLYAFANEEWSVTPVPDAHEGSDAWSDFGDDEPARHRYQLRALLDAMDDGRRPETSGPGLRPTIELIASIYKSAFTGEAVQRGSIEQGDPFYTSFSGGRRFGKA